MHDGHCASQQYPSASQARPQEYFRGTLVEPGQTQLTFLLNPIEQDLHFVAPSETDKTVKVKKRTKIIFMMNSILKRSR